SKLLAVAAFKEGRFVQAFPTFGVERRAAPVKAFVRIDDKPILLRTQIYTPDYVVVMDPSLIQMEDVTQGLKPGGMVLINSHRAPEDYPLSNHYRVVTVDASAIAVRHGLGSLTQPIVNTAILGAVAKVFKIVGIDAVVAAIEEEVSIKTQANVAAAREAYEAAVAPEEAVRIAPEQRDGNP
ncbi:MAG: 2-oxoacid:acceptor oxidoreductase family protein, partial [bacterium]